MGLNSMRLMALAGGWRKRGASITFAELAASPTVDSWHGLLGSVEMRSAAEPAVDQPAAPDDSPFPLAAMQHAYWIGRSDGLPIGGQLIGPHFGEARIISVAAVLERSLDGTEEIR